MKERVPGVALVCIWIRVRRHIGTAGGECDPAIAYHLRPVRHVRVRVCSRNACLLARRVKY
jgi:hypothetical protein